MREISCLRRYDWAYVASFCSSVFVLAVEALLQQVVLLAMVIAPPALCVYRLKLDTPIVSKVWVVGTQHRLTNL